MMIYGFPLLCFFGILGCVRASEDFHCKPDPDNHLQTVCYIPECATAIQNHIGEEMKAAFQYLYMALHFDQDTVNRPGLAKFLYASASEEREHAKLMIDYLNLRGVPFEVPFAINANDLEIKENLTYEAALVKALDMEIEVTDAIYKVTESCGSDFHGADVFTNPILEEQHHGIRKIKGLIKTFEDINMNLFDASERGLAEYIFDTKME